MGHEVRYKVYSGDVNQKNVQAEWDDYVRSECWREGASGLCNSIRWLPAICNTEEEARVYIHTHDKGWYDQLAVRFRSPEKPSPATQELERKMLEAECKHRELQHKFHFADAKAEYIGCKTCGSRIARKYLLTNFCPVCRADMRPETVLKQIKNSTEKVDKLRTKLEEQRCKDAAKSKNLKWLVKIEYHI